MRKEKNSDSKSKSINIVFSKDEALVLFDWLVRFDESDGMFVSDEAEQKVLWNLEGKLENMLLEILNPDYVNLLTEAKKRLRSE